MAQRCVYKLHNDSLWHRMCVKNTLFLHRQNYFCLGRIRFLPSVIYVKYSDFNRREIELYSREGDNSSRFERNTVVWEHTIRDTKNVYFPHKLNQFVTLFSLVFTIKTWTKNIILRKINNTAPCPSRTWFANIKLTSSIPSCDLFYNHLRHENNLLVGFILFQIANAVKSISHKTAEKSLENLISAKGVNSCKRRSSMTKQANLICIKERGGGQTFSTSFWMRFSQAPLCRCRFKVIFDDIIFLLSGNIIEYICFWRFNSIIMTRNKWLVFTKSVIMG